MKFLYQNNIIVLGIILLLSCIIITIASQVVGKDTGNVSLYNEANKNIYNYNIYYEKYKKIQIIPVILKII